MTIVQIAFSLVCIATSVVTNSPNEVQLKWKKHYDSTKQTAQSAKRPMLLVLENPKKNEKIDETKLTEKDRDILAEEEFELCRVDVNTDYGKRVAAAFGARIFPYTVVTDDSSKRIVFRKPGPMSPKDWTLALAKSTRQAVSLAQPTVTQPPSPVTARQVHQPSVPSPTAPPLAPTGWTGFEVPVQGVIVYPQAAPASGTCFT